MSEKKKQEIPMSFEIDDFFSTQDERDDKTKEKIEEIDISLIDNFEKHPFKVVENDELKLLQESIKANGLLSPTIVRKKDNNRYEMVSGHRRKRACQLLGYEKIPCVVKDLTDDEATIIMVDSNLQQRQKLLPSEKAFAYKMKYEAIKHQGTSLQQNITSCPVGTKIRSDNLLAEEVGESARQIQRYIRLTYLIPELLVMADNNELKIEPSMALRPAVEISYLNEKEQQLLSKYIEMNLVTPTVSQAQDIKKLSEEGKLNEILLNEIMDKEKPNQVPNFKIQESKLFNVLPKNIEREKIEDFVLKACSYYSKHLKQRNIER